MFRRTECFPRPRRDELPLFISIPMIIRYDSDSSEDDDETTDNFKNEIGVKGEKEQMQNIEILCKADKDDCVFCRRRSNDCVIKSKSDLKKIMGKVQPLLNQIKNEYVVREEWSSDRVEIKARKILLIPRANTSGIPPPAPCIPLPPAHLEVAPDQEIKIKKHGATLTATRYNGCLCNIEMKIKMSNKEDELSQ